VRRVARGALGGRAESADEAGVEGVVVESSLLMNGGDGGDWWSLVV
jgi:hypothetical protein